MEVTNLIAFLRKGSMERENNKQIAPNGKPSFDIDEQSSKFLLSHKHKPSPIINLFAGLVAFFLLVSSALAIALAYNTEDTAAWLGLKAGQNLDNEIEFDQHEYPVASHNLRTALLRPFAGASLGLLNIFSPTTFETILGSGSASELDGVFVISAEGSIIPQAALNFTDSSYLRISDSTMIPNLNAEYLRGHAPGSRAGDLAIYNENGLIPADKIEGAIRVNTIGNGLELSPKGGLSNKSGLSLKTSCSNNQILVWNGNSWNCSDQSTNSKPITASSPLVYNSETGVLSFNYNTDRWDSSYNHSLAVNNPHNTTSKQVLPDQTGESGKVLGTDGSNVSWVMNSATTLWGAITGTLNNQSDLAEALGGKEDALSSGNSSQYLRGDKTWQNLNSESVGLGNVNNTSDANKPVSNAVQLALNDKANSSTTINGKALTSNISLSKIDIGLSNLDNTQQLPLSYLDTDSTMSANSDSRVASQKAVKSYADTKEPALTKGNLTANGAISLSTTRQVIGGDASISIADSVADGSTKGAAAFSAADFNSSSGVISIDYTNGVAADATHKGFLTSADWNTFNSKQGALGFTPAANTVTVNGYALSSNISLGKSDIGLDSLDNLQQLPLSYLDTDGTLNANSDSKVASQKAVKAYADTKESAISNGTSLKYFRGDKTWQTLDTSVVTENGSLYFTNTRVDSRVQSQNYAVTGSWSFNTAAPQSSVAPTAANDLTNKAYVDSIASGIIPQSPVIDFYDPSSGTPAAPSPGDRYIAEASANDWTLNHIYEWNGSSWTDDTPFTGWAVYVENLTANYGFNGSSWVLTSNLPSHNNLSGLQGGSSNQYYHLTSSQYLIVSNTSGTNTGDETQSTIKSKLGAASSGVDGYLSGADWTTFNNKQGALGFTPVANTVTVNGQALSGNITLSLASANFANQGTANTLLHGNAAGNPTWSAVVTNDVANNNITYAKIQQIAANSIIGNNTGSAANAIELTGSQVKTMLSLVKADVGLGSVENTAISTWSGSANITALGTIASGTWQGTKIAEGYGGTNQSTYTLGDTLYASAANTLSKLAGNTTTTKKFLRQTGTGTNSAAPAWDTVTASDVGLGNVSNVAQVTSVTGTSPISSSGGTTPAISIADSVADGSTKGAAAFSAADFNSSSGVISIDYTNGVAADATHKGFLTSADWNTFNSKQGAGNYITALTGEITASGPGSTVATIANDAVDFAQMQNVNSQVILGRNSVSSGDIEALSASTVKSILSLNNVENTALSTWAGTTNLKTLGAFTATGHVTIEGVTSTGSSGTGKFVFDNSPTLLTPNIGSATATSLSFGTALESQAILLYTNGSAKYGFGVQASELRSFLQSNATVGHTWGVIDVADGTTYTERMRLSATGHLTIEGVTSTGATGTGKFVFDSSPTLTTPTLGAATATSIAMGANTLNTTEWANLDGQNQTVKTTSSPYFAGLGIGVSGSAGLLQHLQAYAGSGYTHLGLPASATTYDAAANRIYTREAYDALSIGLGGAANSNIAAMKFLTYGGTGTSYGARILYANSDATGISSGLHIFTGSGALTHNATFIGGKVGIGTQTPRQSLEVSGGIIRVQGSDPADNYIDINPNAGSAPAFLQVRRGNSDYVGLRHLMLQPEGGFVGIGTAPAVAGLTVDSNSNTNALRIMGTDGVNEISDIYVGGTGALVLDTTAGTDTGGYIDLRSEDDAYGVIIRQSDGAATTNFANIYVANGTVDYMKFTVKGTLSSTPGLALDANGAVYIGDTANAKSFAGLTINQRDKDDEIVTLQSSDVLHPFTDLTEADSYGVLSKFSATAGGLSLEGYSDTDATGLYLRGIMGTTAPLAGRGAIRLDGLKSNGLTSSAALANTDTILEIRNATTTKVRIFGDGGAAFSGDISTTGSMQAGGYKSSDGTAGTDISCTAGKSIKTVTFKNGLLTAATCTTNALTDLAENYGATDVNIEAGDVVAASATQAATIVNTESGQSSKAYIEKANSSNSSSVLGIVSSNPQMTLGEDIFSPAENPRPVALSGRVLVKANDQNGPIKKGDLLTVSNTDGYASKVLDDSTVIIGTALEDLTASQGRIIVFVNISHKLGSSSVIELASTGALKVDTLTVEGDALFKGIIRGNDKFAGKAVMPAGQTEIRVSKSWPSAPTSVIVTPSFDARAWTTDITESGFVIRVADPAALDGEISWIAIF